ncbi:rhamnulokinase family protein [Leifsonia sp. NPDC058292]|uniref:rhamnulokinase n=1 Tax=Leifsonia sp. NPDC058292 TaxID=3346428 RepID=UPI0036D9CB32
MTEAGVVAAIDLGAASGRVMLGYVGDDELRLVPVTRFPNIPVRTIDGLHWNILELYNGIGAGLSAAARLEPEVRSIGIDSWAVDYALLSGGRMLGNPYHYRDERSSRGVAATHERVPAADLFRRNGLQFLPFNTLYQLVSDQQGGWLDHSDTMLLIPDLIGYWLTGEPTAERTNASTTGLLNIHTQRWDEQLLDVLGIPWSLMPRLVDSGTTIGMLEAGAANRLGFRTPPAVTAVGSHDTASAVVAVPTRTENFAYISSGTWSLVGVELDHPVVTEASREANFTNERGVDDRVRFLTNVSGLWLLTESIRTWEREDSTRIELAPLLRQAADVTDPMPRFDVGDPVFIAQGDMPLRIAEWCTNRGRRPPQTRAEFVRSILESLADAYADALEQASQLSGHRIDVIHIVGGGSQNELLCQLTADRAGRPVIAGPVEATAIGNVLVQARSQGLIHGPLEVLRSRVASATSLQRFAPRTVGALR